MRQGERPTSAADHGHDAILGEIEIDGAHERTPEVPFCAKGKKS